MNEEELNLAETYLKIRMNESGEDLLGSEGSDIRERRRHLSAAERRRRAKYRKTAAFKKAQRRYNKKTSRAGYRPSKTRSKASKKAARYRKRY